MITQGMYVVHLHRKEWGVGKVLEGGNGATFRLWFEMGGERKIGSDYCAMLQQVAIPPSFHVPSVTSSPPPKSTGERFHRDYFSGRWEFTFSKSERDRFKTGQLVRQWAEQYPFLFGPEDVDSALAAEQKRWGCFYDWASAVRLYEMRGYYSLLRGYAALHQQRKLDIVETLCGERTKDIFPQGAKGTYPDLLVYTPDLSEWFFCEVKGPGDGIRKSEESSFPALAASTGKDIYLITLSLR